MRKLIVRNDQRVENLPGSLYESRDKMTPDPIRSHGGVRDAAGALEPYTRGYLLLTSDNLILREQIS
jgi:hypothetical protein